WFGEKDLPLSFEDADCLYSQFDLHREFKEAAARLGRPSDPFPFPAVVYLANHSESLRVKQFDRMREVNLFSLVLPRHARNILQRDFSCADVTMTAAQNWPFISGVAISTIRQLWHRGVRYTVPGQGGFGERGDPADVIKEIRGAPESFPLETGSTVNDSRGTSYRAAKQPNRNNQQLADETQTNCRTSIET